jgi:hypothetical protein
VNLAWRHRQLFGEGHEGAGGPKQAKSEDDVERVESNLLRHAVFCLLK